MSDDRNQMLAERLADYRTERWEFWTRFFPLLAVFCVGASSGMAYLADTYLGGLVTDWKIVAATFSIAVLVPPVWVMSPEKPSVESVEHDKVLNAIAAAAQRPSN